MQFQHLYFHFPFCEARCHYCDFYALAQNRIQEKDVSRFHHSLRKELELQIASISPELKSIFFGGGTPSLSSIQEIKYVIEPLIQQIRNNKTPIEWTMECNPSSSNPQVFEQLLEIGVNRLSFGIQSTHPHLLKLLGRVHNRDQAFQAVQSAFQAGFTNFSVDLMCGIPGQTIQELEQSIEELTSLPITHLSCYLLTLAPHHPMFKDLPNEDTQIQHLLFIDQKLKSLGFRHYEISNFCKNNLRSEHNLAYWSNRPYLGFGPSAHSFAMSQSNKTGELNSYKRWKNFSSLQKYIQSIENGQIPTEQLEELTSDQIQLEKWMLALRLDEGFSKHWLETSKQQNTATHLVKEGYLETHPTISNNLRLTPLGFTLSDQIALNLSTD